MVNAANDGREAQTIVLSSEVRGVVRWFSPDDNSSADAALLFNRTTVWLLKPRALQDEVNRLVRAGQSSRAVGLLEYVLRDRVSEPDQAVVALRDAYLDMSLYMMSQTMFDDAIAMLKQLVVDPRSLVPLLPEVADILRDYLLDDRDVLVSRYGTLQMMVVNFLNESFPDAEESFAKELVIAGTRMLADYILWFKSLPKTSAVLCQICDSALLIMYLEADSAAIYAMLGDPGLAILPVVEPLFRARGKHHALALLLHRSGDAEQAWVIWKSLLRGDISDPDFHGVPSIAEHLLAVKEPAQFWAKAQLAFDSNVEEGLKMLRALPLDDPRSDHDKVVEFLAPYGRRVPIAYLEWLVHTVHSSDERFHTQLALLYLDDLLELSSGPDAISSLDEEFKGSGTNVSFFDFVASRKDPLSSSRSRLLKFLRFSNHCRTPILLAKLGAIGDLYAEKAVLMAKSGDYERALKLLVHELDDFVGAEELCTTIAADHAGDGEYGASRTNPFAVLLGLYLGIKDENTRTHQVVRLINNPKNTAHVLDVCLFHPSKFRQLTRSSLAITANRSTFGSIGSSGEVFVQGGQHQGVCGSSRAHALHATARSGPRRASLLCLRQSVFSAGVRELEYAGAQETLSHSVHTRSCGRRLDTTLISCSQRMLYIDDNQS
ncbi:hypothetical protein DFJ74DRAFT_322117 [Hyaloraphidium curvatum]|nr:hypothetical protein DFJ74DRAFT_322117 [Hyaloraphidium curvatum]